MQKVNPTQTKAWKALQAHFEDIKDVEMKNLFEDQSRAVAFTLKWEDFYVDYSKNRITQETKSLLLDLAKEMNLEEAKAAYFGGAEINETEGRAVMHTALRQPSTASVKIDGEDVIPEVNEVKEKIKSFNEQGIIVNAIEQPLDLSIPEQGLMLAVYLSMPEVENHRRSLNVIAGMRRAFKEGRYIVSPPKGYDMGRDNQNKPILIPNHDAIFIKEGFELLSKGIYSQKEVLQKLRDKGFNSSKSAFGRIIRNPIYFGSISY